MSKSNFQKIASRAAQNIFRVSANPEKDPDWQRVHSYIADTIKDSYVLYAKLARLRGDFGGSELEELDAVSATVRDVGSALSAFSENFVAGDYSMAKKEPFGSDDMAMGDAADFGDEPDVEFNVIDDDALEESEDTEEKSEKGKKEKSEEEAA